MEYQLSARPLTVREPGRVYGSWMDDPRRVLERRLNEMKAGERFEFAGYVITRPGYEKVLHVCQAGKLAHHASGSAAKQSVIEFVIGKPDKGTEEMSEYTISKRAMELLQAANKPLGVSTTGKGTIVAIKALQRQGLVEIWKDGKARTTELGREFLISNMSAKQEEHAAPATEPAQAFDVQVEITNQPIVELEPELSPSSNGVPPVDAAPIPELPGLSGVGECNCTYRRALEYLMEQVPEVREAFEGYVSLEKSTAKLLASAVTHRG